MSKLITILVAGMMSFGVMAAEKEKVCIDVKDPKTGKVTQQCKEIKKHKKLEGTEVPKK
jgi:nitrate reductase cytochrome c-type subunit